MMRLVLLAFTIVAALAAAPRAAHANSCNLYYEQRFGQFREGCSISVFALPTISPHLPTVTRNGQELTPTVVQDEVTLKVTFTHYPSADSCELLPPEYENRTFAHYELTWPDLKGGDEIVVDGFSVVVPGPGDCGVPEPAFYCTDPIQSCSDPVDPDPDPDNLGDDTAGCSAGSGTPSWLVILGVAAILRSCSRRSRASSRR